MVNICGLAAYPFPLLERTVLKMSAELLTDSFRVENLSFKSVKDFKLIFKCPRTIKTQYMKQQSEFN